MLRKAYDASVPPSAPLAGTAAAFGYVGGNTPHVWTLPQWNAATANGKLRCMPIWTADFTASPEAQAESAALAAVSLGWHAHVARWLTLDSETSYNVAFIHAFGSRLHHLGFVPVDYRSASALMAAPSGLEEWVARWDDPAGPFTRQADMYQVSAGVEWDGTTVDVNIVGDHAYEHFGRGLRREHH
jgi:hypothetical protein